MGRHRARSSSLNHRSLNQYYQHRKRTPQYVPVASPSRWPPPSGAPGPAPPPPARPSPRTPRCPPTTAPAAGPPCCAHVGGRRAGDATMTARGPPPAFRVDGGIDYIMSCGVGESCLSIQSVATARTTSMQPPTIRRIPSVPIAPSAAAAMSLSALPAVWAWSCHSVKASRSAFRDVSSLRTHVLEWFMSKCCVYVCVILHMEEQAGQDCPCIERGFRTHMG